jgi:hypothetical protein
MNSLSASLFSVLFLAMAFSAGICEAAETQYLMADVPTCGHIGSSSSADYIISIAQDVSSASFTLNWRANSSQMDLAFSDPQGRGVKPDYRSQDAAKAYVLEGPAAGNWKIIIKSGDLSPDGEDYCLTARLEKVSPKNGYLARFNGIFRDSVHEENGVIDYITLAAGVNVKSPGNYSAEAILFDVNSGQVHYLQNKRFLNLGAQFLTLDLLPISSPGPYRLKQLTLYDELGRSIDISDAPYTTETYDQKKVRLPAARLNGRFTDRGVDTDSDGRYEFLTLDVGIDVMQPGNYSLMGMLYDSEGKQVVWSVSYAILEAGSHVMPIDFDGKAIGIHKFNGTYVMRELVLMKGDSRVEEGLAQEDSARDAYATGPYNYTQFLNPAWAQKILSGSGSGGLLLTIVVSSILPVYEGRYSLDLMGVSMPPISADWNVSFMEGGYWYDLPGVLIPGKPNDFSVKASRVKSLSVGVKQERGEMPQMAKAIQNRAWVSQQASAGQDGSAVVQSDFISPGRYQFKVLGEAADNVTEVCLEMRMIKKLIINGEFSLALDMSGFPVGSYSIDAKALNGSFCFDEINLQVPSP